MPDTVNEVLRTKAITHAIDLNRYSNSVVRDMLRILASADNDVLTQLAVALQRLADIGAGTQLNVRRLDDILSGTRDLLKQVYAQADRTLQQDLRDFTAAELDYQTNTLNEATPDAIAVRTPSIQQVYAAAEAEPFQGRLLTEWFTSLGANAQQRIRDTIAQGFVQGKTNDELITAVRGTRAQGYSDGVMIIDRRHAESVVRTAVSHTAATARDEFVKANADLIDEVMWVSTLDNRTTEECMIRDGLLYTVDGEPVDHKVPWLDGPGNLHWNCRSTSTPVLMSAKQLGLDLPPLERAAMNGVAPEGTTYGAWLKAQPAHIQDDVLGKTRADEFRAGKVSFEKFFNDKGEFLTLEQLKAKR